VFDHLAALTLFALVGAFTPGPNNIMVTASGAAFGFARTVPHIAGVTVGFAVMVVAFGLGLGALFQRYPNLHHWVRIAGAAYLLYLAWRIARAGDPAASAGAARPLSFMEAALFQWLNVKAWTLALGVIAAFTTVGGSLSAELAMITVVFTFATIASLVAWCLFGMAIRQMLASPRSRRIVNLSLAALLALSVVTLFL
jgi:threonine/homoserine/homoserine lactone efflux protein